MSRHETTGRGAVKALALLLSVNLFNYIDRYILAAVEPEIRKAFFAPDDPDAMAKTGSLATAFLVSYLVAAPLFGWLADRVSRWWLIAAGVAVWSLASGGTGLVAGFGALVAMRVFVGVGEASYGPSAPALISDLFPVERRGRMLSFFYMAIPVGSAIGYAFGGGIGGAFGWRWPFYLVVVPGLILAGLSLAMRDPRDRAKRASSAKRAGPADYRAIFKTPSYLINTAAMTAMTFAIGGLSFWVPAYIAEYRGAGSLASVNMTFGLITVVAGLLATLSGGMIGDWLRGKIGGAYFVVSGVGILAAFPFSVAMLFVPFPLAWVFVALAVFFIFFNTGPANTVLANVTSPAVRATAFAMNIFIIHAFGDAISPPLIGVVAGRHGMNAAFLLVSAMLLVAGVLWLIGVRFLDRDTAAVVAPGDAPED
jgi:MFS family permease